VLAPLPEHVEALRSRLGAFMDEHIYPNERELLKASAAEDEWEPSRLSDELASKAKAAGLWNLFYSGPEGHGLTNYQYAHLCEMLGRSLAAPAVFNCHAPDAGNISVLALFGTQSQQEKWLAPLLSGEIRSCFALTEPQVASSDAVNIETRIERDGAAYVINGRKSWVTGVLSEKCKLAIVMGKSDPHEPRRQSMVLVPTDTIGLTVERSRSVYGYAHPPLGHGDVILRDVRVPAGNMLLGEGMAFTVAQQWLAPVRLHHCMRLIGLAERALEAMCDRAKGRSAFGSTLADMGAIRQVIGQSRCQVDQARLVTLRAAWKMDELGSKQARNYVSIAKAVVPAMAGAVIDRAVQIHGSAGLSEDFFLAEAFAESRFLRIGDGPDEVHRDAIARAELAR
jgi:acyl-CoA dehydrogenase